MAHGILIEYIQQIFEGSTPSRRPTIMKLNVPYYKIADIDHSIVDKILSSIDEEDWFTNDYRKVAAAKAMSNCNSIPIMHTPKCILGFISKNDTCEAIKDIHKYPAYEKLYPTLEPVFNTLKKYYKFNRWAAFIARLAPNSPIAGHYDLGKFLTLCHRIHLPLQTHPDVKYIIDDIEYHWKKGELIEFDNTRWHSVENNSDLPRIHLVINLYNLTDDELNS